MVTSSFLLKSLLVCTDPEKVSKKDSFEKSFEIFEWSLNLIENYLNKITLFCGLKTLIVHLHSHNFLRKSVFSVRIIWLRCHVVYRGLGIRMNCTPFHSCTCQEDVVFAFEWWLNQKGGTASFMFIQRLGERSFILCMKSIRILCSYCMLLHRTCRILG